MLAFRSVFLVVVLAGGCGGQTNTSGGTGGSSAGATGTAGTGMASGGSGASTGVTSGTGGCGDVAFGCPLPQCASSPACGAIPSNLIDAGSANGGGSSAGVPFGATLVYPGDGCGITVICPTGQNCQSGICAPIADASAETNGDGTEADADAGAPPSCAPGGPGVTNCGPGGTDAALIGDAGSDAGDDANPSCGPLPAGCARIQNATPCEPGFICDPSQGCTPSACDCWEGLWGCTADCGGGVCVAPDAAAPGVACPAVPPRIGEPCAGPIACPYTPACGAELFVCGGATPLWGVTAYAECSDGCPPFEPSMGNSCSAKEGTCSYTSACGGSDTVQCNGIEVVAVQIGVCPH